MFNITMNQKQLLLHSFSLYVVFSPCVCVQECGKQLSDKPGSQCFPLDSHLLCHSCHMSRVCASHSLPSHNTHWMGERPVFRWTNLHCFVITYAYLWPKIICHCVFKVFALSLFFFPPPPPAHTCCRLQHWKEVVWCYWLISQIWGPTFQVWN